MACTIEYYSILYKNDNLKPLIEWFGKNSKKENLYGNFLQWFIDTYYSSKVKTKIDVENFVLSCNKTKLIDIKQCVEKKIKPKKNSRIYIDFSNSTKVTDKNVDISKFLSMLTALTEIGITDIYFFFTKQSLKFLTNNIPLLLFVFACDILFDRFLFTADAQYNVTDDLIGILVAYLNKGFILSGDHFVEFYTDYKKVFNIPITSTLSETQEKKYKDKDKNLKIPKSIDLDNFLLYNRINVNSNKYNEIREIELTFNIEKLKSNIEKLLIFMQTPKKVLQNTESKPDEIARAKKRISELINYINDNIKNYNSIVSKDFKIYDENLGFRNCTAEEEEKVRLSKQKTSKPLPEINLTFNCYGIEQYEDRPVEPSTIKDLLIRQKANFYLRFIGVCEQTKLIIKEDSYRIVLDKIRDILSFINSPEEFKDKLKQAGIILDENIPNIFFAFKSIDSDKKELLCQILNNIITKMENLLKIFQEKIIMETIKCKQIIADSIGVDTIQQRDIIPNIFLQIVVPLSKINPSSYYIFFTRDNTDIEFFKIKEYKIILDDKINNIIFSSKTIVISCDYFSTVCKDNANIAFLLCFLLVLVLLSRNIYLVCITISNKVYEQIKIEQIKVLFLILNIFSMVLITEEKISSDYDISDKKDFTVVSNPQEKSINIQLVQNTELEKIGNCMKELKDISCCIYKAFEKNISERLIFFANNLLKGKYTIVEDMLKILKLIKGSVEISSDTQNLCNLYQTEIVGYKSLYPY